MKKFLQTILTLVCVFATFAAKAQDEFSATVTWDMPGSIQVFSGSSPSSGTLIELADDATSFTATEKGDYMFIPTNEYYIDSVEMNGASESLVKNYTTGGYYYKLSATYSNGVAKYNGQTVEIKMARYEIVGQITIDIENGASQTSFQFQDGNGNTTAVLTPEDGTNTYDIRNVDTRLYFKASGYPVPSFYKAVLNGEDIPQESNGSYLVDITSGDVISLALNDPSTVKDCTVKFVFTNDNPECVASVRDWSNSAWLQDTLSANNWETVVESGTKLAINIASDINVNSITSSPAVEFVNSSVTELASGVQFIINDDTVITIDATAIIYEDQTAIIYTNNIEGLVLGSEYGLDETDLTVTEIAEKAADTVTFEMVDYTIPVATTEYEISGISGKTNRFFFHAKSGYYIADGAFANVEKESGDGDSYYKLNGAASTSVDKCPLFLDVRKIEASTPAVLYFKGTEGSSARVQSYGPDGENAAYEGQESTLAEGYTLIKFDPTYNKTFTVRLSTSSSYDKYYVYVDGYAVSSSSESDLVFEGITLSENSVLKAFVTLAAPSVHTLNFTVEDGASATLTYDEYVSTSDFSAPIRNVGNVEYTFTPADGTTILVDGVALEAPYSFTPSASTVEIELTKTSEVNGISAEEGSYTVVTLTGIVVLKDAEAAALESLPKGIYIINGKKVAVK